MRNPILPLIAACALPLSAGMADDLSLPQNWSQEEKALYTSVDEKVVELLSSDKVTSMKTPERQIKHTFTQLVKSFGVEYRLVIAKALSAHVPSEMHGYVAKRALAYSPLRAKELLASLNQEGSSVSSALGTLPTANVHTAATASAAGVEAQPGRVFQLPQVDARRRVVSRDGNGRIISAQGQIDLGGGPQPVSIQLGPVEDNGFTLDGMAYQVQDASGLVGNYLAIRELGNGDLELFFKNKTQGTTGGSGPDGVPGSPLVITNVN